MLFIVIIMIMIIEESIKILIFKELWLVFKLVSEKTKPGEKSEILIEIWGSGYIFA